MRILTTLGLVLVISSAAFSQTTATPVTVYENSYQAIDAAGNLVVFDSGYTYIPSTSTGRRVERQSRNPRVRITVVRPAGAPETREYAASVSVVGIGKLALYAVATTYTTTATTVAADSRLIALNPQVSLPATLTTLPNIILPASRFNVDSTQPDILSILTAAITASTASGTTTTTAPRTVKVVRFNGASFDTVSTATLP